MSSPGANRRGGSLPTVVALALLLFPYPLAWGAPGGGPVPAAVPIALVLQPGAGGMDAFILNTTRDWNFGDNVSLVVGRDVANGSLARSLLRFDLSGLPATAQVVNATLELYRVQGTGGGVQVRRAFSPWNEGSGERSWNRIPVVVRERVGVRRVLEPVAVVLPFGPYGVGDPQRDLQVFRGSTAVPSQVYQYSYGGGRLVSARVFFEATVGARGTAYFNFTYSTNGSAVPAYRTRTFQATPLWTFDPNLRGESTPSIVDLDGDNRLDVVFGAINGTLYALDDGGRLKWLRPISSATWPIPYPPQVKDIDGDGNMDIVVQVNDPAVLRLDRFGSTVWSVPYGGGNMISAPPTLVDVNGDGVLDVLVSGKFNQVDALNGISGAPIRSFPAGGATFPVAIKDLDGDGSGEIFFGSDDALVHAYRTTGVQMWASGPANASFIENAVSIGDVNNDGIPDVVTGDDTNNQVEFALRATDGSILWVRNLPDFRESSQTIVDLDLDGTMDLAVGLYNGEMHALRASDGAPRWWVPSPNTWPDTPAAVDVDKDGRPELVYMDTGPLVRVLNATGGLVHSWTVTPNDYAFRTIVQHPCGSPAVVDLDGDGTMEVIVPTGAGLQAFATPGLAKDWRTWQYNWNHTGLAYDGNSPDGVAPLEVALGALQVYPGAGASWNYSDGSIRWAAQGGDFGMTEATTVGVAGWTTLNVTGMVTDWHNPVGFPNVGLFVTEADEATGGLHRFVSSDSPDGVHHPRLVIYYTLPSADPTPRIVGILPDQVRAEDSPPWTMDLRSYAFDNDTPLSQLRWNVTGYDPARIAITGLNVPGNHNLTFRPVANAYGSVQVTYWLTDPDGWSVRQMAWLNLTPVNDAPTFNPPSTLIVHYNSTYTFDFTPYIADPDDPPANLTLTSNDPVRAPASGFNVSFLYPYSYLNQWVFVTLTVSDGKASTARVVPVKVTSDNPPRVTRKLPNLTIIEGQILKGVFDLDDFFTDPDQDSLFFSYGYSHLNITIHPNHTVDVRALAEWSGQERVTFRASDPTGAIAEDTILITVVAVNDPPVIGQVPDLRVRYDAPYTFNLDPYLSDADTPGDSLSVTTNSSYISTSGHLITLLFPQALNGTVQAVNITVSDGIAVGWRVIRVSVGDDWPPILQVKLGDRRFAEDTVLRGAYNLSVAFADPDGTQLYYSSGNQSIRVTIGSQGMVDLSAERDWSGAERVTFRATDPAGGLAEDVVWIGVDPVNDAPGLKPVPTQAVNSTAAFLDLTPYLVDVDNNLSDITLSTSSLNATVIGHGILLTYHDDGREEVEVVVSDGSLTNSTRFTVVVDLPTAPGEGLPPYLLWLPFPIGAAAFAAFLLYRRRGVDWAYLATAGGLVVATMFRRGSPALDTDQIAGLMTAIQDFAAATFSDEDRRRTLEGLHLGDRRVALERGQYSYLAVVYKGRAPGSLPRIMKSFIKAVEERHGPELKDFMDTSTMADIPGLMGRLVNDSWWPFLRFDGKGPAPRKPGGSGSEGGRPPSPPVQP